MEEKELYIDVLLPLALHRPLTYRVPSWWNMPVVGQRVIVPLGKYKFYSGLVIRLHCNRPEGYTVKEAQQMLDDAPLVTGRQLEFWKWMADYYLSSEGEVMAAALPSGFKIESESKVGLDPEFSGEVSNLTPKELRLVSLLSERGCISLREIGREFTGSEAIWLVRNLLEKNIIVRCEEIGEKYVPRTRSCISLADRYAADENELAELFSALEKNSRLQKQSDTLLIFLSLSRNMRLPSVPKQMLLESERVSESSLRQLLKKGVLCQKEVEVSRLGAIAATKNVENISLTDVQQNAMESVLRQWERFPTVLLHGVTGSGKTEIYIRLIKDVLAQGRQVLYLLPEIALTAQIINRLQCYFGGKAGVYHSRFNEQERMEIWKRVKADDETAYQVIIGARSSLFLPFRQLGMIIIDEEHDASYKQYDPSPRYHARDAAMVLARQHGAKVLLGSATPSVESYANAVRGKYGLVVLGQRYAGMEMPEIRMVDMRSNSCGTNGGATFSQELLDRIGQALECGEQIILFQNRRGYSPHLECGDCHHVPVCKYCDVAMTYHKDRHQLRCHYCGYTEPLPQVCPQCSGNNFQMSGFGTEKVEEELTVHFPDVRIARLDYDSTRSRTAFQKIISDFETGKIRILVGTQMVTKGLDFDNVSTVGILNADQLLHYPDFRAYERAFQVLSQVSGRAGRRKRRGLVLVQSYCPDHPLFHWVTENNYEAMYRQVMAERGQFVYPPYCRFVKLTLKHRDAVVLNRAAAVWVQMLRRRFGSAVLGPAFPAVPRIKNLYIKDIIVKLTDMRQLSAAKDWIRQSADALVSDKAFRTVLLSFDVDPY